MVNVIKIIIAMIILLHFVQPDIVLLNIIVVMDITQNTGLVVVVTRMNVISVKPEVGINVLLKSVFLFVRLRRLARFVLRF